MVQQLGDVVRGDEIVDAGHPAFRVDRQDTLRHHLGFRLPDMLAQRVDLAVGIGNADIIHVDQSDGADAGARQRLSRPGTHAADADHADVRLREHRQRLLAVQSRRAAETLQIGFRISCAHNALITFVMQMIRAGKSGPCGSIFSRRMRLPSGQQRTAAV